MEEPIASGSCRKEGMHYNFSLPLECYAADPILYLRSLCALSTIHPLISSGNTMHVIHFRKLMILENVPGTKELVLFLRQAKSGTFDDIDNTNSPSEGLIV